MLIVNLFGAPGAGKSTGAAYIFSRLKMAGVNAELVTEFAKDKVWEGSTEAFRNQAYLFGEQYFRISRLQNKVDVVVTDSPILLSGYYQEDPALGEEFDACVSKVFNSYSSMNVFIDRVKPYNEAGRRHTEAESNQIAHELTAFLDHHNIACDHYVGDMQGYDQIVDAVLLRITSLAPKLTIGKA